MNNLTEKILKKIKKEKILVKPRWEVILKRGLVWSALGTAVLLLALAISMIIFQLEEEFEWELLPRFFEVRPPLFLQILPYFWLFIAALLFTFVYFDFRKTKTGYRYSTTIIMISSLLLSLALGLTIFKLKTPHRLEPFFRERMPFYESVRPSMGRLWMNPEDGLLGGIVMSELKDKRFELEDLRGDDWEVVLIEPKPVFGLLVEPGNSVKITGKILKRNEFEAEKISPWKLPEMDKDFPGGR